MEMRRSVYSLIHQLWRTACCVIAFMVLLADQASAQEPAFNIKGGKIHVVLPLKIAEKEIDNFINKFDLKHLALKKFLKDGFTDSLIRDGWNVDNITNTFVTISKPLNSSDVVNDPAGRIILAGEKPWRVDLVFPVVSNSVTLGYNRFRNKSEFKIRDSVVTFFLRGNMEAKNVHLAGSFNDWDSRSIQMSKTDSGWIVGLKLIPGKYWYKFIIDGQWKTDNDNRLSENDGHGNTNSVYFFTNTVFRLKGYTNNRRVYVAGSFNGWDGNELSMQKTSDGWQLPVYLKDGTHTYRYVVDGNWMPDPGNTEKLPNEFHDFNSVITIGNPHIFRLPGNTEAKEVILTGSFNGWRKDELFMHKTAAGWEYPYVLGAGNHEYAFVVDGKQIADPQSKTLTGNHNSSYLVIQPNYTFRLSGFENAKNVYLSGEFNFWSPNSLAMIKENGAWTITVHLSPGKHLYKFVVDGKWIIDPDNKLWEQNEHETGNSVLWVDK